MPEIMSAEELFCEIEQIMSDSHGYDVHEIKSVISSRDSAMLEKYKNKINSFAIDHQTIILMLAALDSAFADEIEGENKC